MRNMVLGALLTAGALMPATAAGMSSERTADQTEIRVFVLDKTGSPVDIKNWTGAVDIMPAHGQRTAFKLEPEAMRYSQRAWALANPRVAMHLERIDRGRLARLVALFTGLTGDRASPEAGAVGRGDGAPGERATSHRRGLAYRTVTVTGLEKRIWPEGPLGPPLGRMAPAGVVTVPTGEAFSVP